LYFRQTALKFETPRRARPGNFDTAARKAFREERYPSHYPGRRPAVSSIVKYIGEAGETHTAIRGPQETVWRVPEAETRSGVARDYTWLGIHHIWLGMDHLLFILCLIWIAGSPRRILTTITGFTLAHSVTLALSALDLIRVPVPPVEAAIALSVVFLATEVAKGRRDNLTWRYPIAVSGSFGLLHGLGFAAVLNEIGLPQTELVTGLLFFNVGVEIGQALFAVLVIAALFLVRRAAVLRMSEEVLNTRLRYAMSYGVGCTASYWLAGRVASFLDSVPM
jgi:hydrogenase/urease accessory protein HupE